MSVWEPANNKLPPKWPWLGSRDPLLKFGWSGKH